MTKFEARVKEVVEAYQFTGGEANGRALVEIVEQGGSAHARWRPVDRTNQSEHIKLVTDTFSEYLRVGSWLVIRPEDNIATHMTDEEFNNRFVVVKAPKAALIWKDIPGFPNWQVSNNDRVRNVGYGGYKRRTKDGTFFLRRNGKSERWSEAQIGDSEQIKAFFNE